MPCDLIYLLKELEEGSLPRPPQGTKVPYPAARGHNVIKEIVLIEAAGDRVPKAIKQLIDEYLKPVANSVCNQFGQDLRRLLAESSSDFACQLISETWVKLFGDGGGFESYDGRGSLTGWLRTIMGRIVVDSLRKDSRGRVKPVPPEALDLLFPGNSDPSEGPVAEDLCDFIQQFLKKFPTGVQVVFKLREAGFDTKVVGKILDIHQGTVTRWHEAVREALRLKLFERSDARKQLTEQGKGNGSTAQRRLG